MTSPSRSRPVPRAAARTVVDKRTRPRVAPQSSPSSTLTGGPQPAGLRSVDAAVGMVFGLLAGSNLAQGAWLADYPWANLTTAAFLLSVPIALSGLRRRTTAGGALVLLLLMFALALGYLEPALSDSAGQKRTSIVAAVLSVVVASYLSLTNPRRLKWFFITLVCLAGSIILGQAVAPDPVARATGRLTPLGLNAIGAGRAVGSGLVLVLALVLQRGRQKRRLLWVVLALVLGVSLYLDGSRGPVVGVLVSIMVLVWQHPTLRRIPKLALLATFGLLSALAYEQSRSSLSRLTDQTTSGRDELYRQAALIAIDHPQGIGWGNFSWFAPAGLPGGDRSGNLYAHNIILEFWVEAGVIGALAFTAVVIIVGVKAFRGSAQSVFGLALAALLVNLLTGAMLSSDIIGNRMLWVVLGAVLAAEGLPRDVTRVPPQTRLRR